MNAIGGRFHSTRPIHLLVLAVGLTATMPSVAETSPRKCSPPAGFPRPAGAETPLLMMDGVVIGDSHALYYGTDGSMSYPTPSGMVRVPREEVISVTIICILQEMEGQMVERGTISVGTRSGAEGMMRRYLTELVELQETYRRANGRYAAALDQLGYQRTSHPLAAELKVVDGGWSAMTLLGWKSCRIAVGTAATAEMPGGEMKCVQLEASGSPASPSGIPPTIQIQARGGG